MTISVWRYGHFALAVSSFLFIALAAITGIILSFEPISSKTPSYKVDNFNQITLAQTIPALNHTFLEVTDVSVDANQFVQVKGTDTSGNSITAYVDPGTGRILGKPGKKNEFFQWVTSLHRSLFLHDVGRFFVGLTAFLLLLIAISGAILVIQRQRGLKRFFTSIVKENFAQYYHVVLGRLSLIIIIVIALSGTYLSLVRFNVFPEKKITHHISPNALKTKPAKKPADFAAFKAIKLSEVQTIEFPFSDEPEDYYTLKLNNREVVVNQFTGDVLSEIYYPTTTLLAHLSLNWHTGRVSNVWAIILAIAALNILFFIYSGFTITIKRLRNRVSNTYKLQDCRFVILAGSENGTTMGFAKAIHQQLIANGETCYFGELNSYIQFPKAQHLIIFTSTYGLGNAPSNANRFATLVKKHTQIQPIHFSVVGFGSHSYPDFCQFAYEANNLLTAQDWATPLLEIHTINDKSPEQFNQWLVTWAQKAGLSNIVLPEALHQKPTGLETFTVVEKTAVAQEEGAFIIRLKPSSWKTKFSSGDLLAVYPANDYRERLYSIGKMGNQVQLCVKLHPQGLGSNYLYQLTAGDTVEARIIANEHFQFPVTAPAVIMISNGTGIAPFLGMLTENNKKTACYLYGGFRNQASFAPFKDAIDKNIANKQLNQYQVAYSREHKKQYVKHLLEQDADFIAQTLSKGGVLMLCGSLSMQHDVLAWLEQVCQQKNGHSISHYQAHEQILMDCY